ncbi:hypothetical protein KR026_009908 [Drosophila bipectinata]|nr:hypothetical protein KR026_009908 [Drosophila bipectinata]
MSPCKDPNPCVICGSGAELMCNRCGEPYCSADCQQQDWQRHKYYCTSMPALVKINANVKKPLEEVGELQKPLPLKTLESNAPKPTVESMDIKSPDQRPNLEVPNENPLQGQVHGSNAPKPTVDSTDIKSVIENVEKKPVSEPLSKAWREAYLPSGEDFFEARVTYMEKEGPFWVVEASHVERLERLMDNLMRQMILKKLEPVDNVESGSLVAVVVDGKVHRGHVVAVSVQEKTAEIRMIDNGALVAVQFQDIYKGIPKMFDIKAFAFRVKQPTTTGVQLNKNLSLRFVSNKMAEGFFNVQMKPKMTIPLNLPTELLKVTPELTVVKVFENDISHLKSETILVQLKALDNINHELNEILTKKPLQNLNGPFPDEKCTFFLAARTKDGYRRAFLLDHIEFPTPTFLVYEMDEGKVTLCSDVCRIPSQLLGLPMRVFSIAPQEPIYSSLKEEGSGDELSVKFKQELPYGKDRLRTLNANLLSKNGKSYGLVRLNIFLGTVADLGHKFWRHPINNTDLVYITHVVSYRELYISSKDTQRYASIFNRLESKCSPFKENTEIPVGGIVLVVCPKLGTFRGEIKNISKNGEYDVENVDTGARHTVDFKVLRVSCRFLENLPVSLMRVKLKTLRDIPEAAVPPNSGAPSLLNTICAQQEIFVLDMPNSNLLVDLLPRSGDQESLVGRILPVMFTPAKSEETSPPAKPTPSPSTEQDSPPAVLLEPVSSVKLPPSPPSSPDQTFSVDARQLLELSTASVKHIMPFERFYYDDLTKHLVPLGENVEIICLNAINLQKTGFITACFFLNEKVAENFQNLLALVAHHGTCVHNSVTTYTPGIGELCLAIYSGDDGWYRGVCLENDNKMIKILYCDFGNIETVPLEKIKPLPNDALHPVYATKCFIDDFDRTEDFTPLEEYLTRHAKVTCHVRNGPETDTRIITIPNLDNILTKVDT